MNYVSTLAGKTMIMSGGSRGIGLAIALRAAADGANVVLLAKTAQPHASLDGTIFTAADAIAQAGGSCLPVVGDVRDERSVAEAVDRAVDRFGGVDIVVNNASAIDLRKTDEMEMKRYDLMQDVNCRGTYLLSKLCIPHLRQARNPHILTLSPPLNLNPRWAGAHLAYTIAKYGMSLCTLGLAEECRSDGIAANSLWPKTYVATAAVQNVVGGSEAMAKARRPEIVADAAHAIFSKSSREATGNFYIDEDVLLANGISDLSVYSIGDGELVTDLFLD